MNAAESWRTEAACRDTDPDIFFPHDAFSNDWDVPRAICILCAVHEACLEFALVTNQADGMWGGATPDERRGVRRTWRLQSQTPVNMPLRQRPRCDTTGCREHARIGDRFCSEECRTLGVQAENRRRNKETQRRKRAG